MHHHGSGRSGGSRQQQHPASYPSMTHPIRSRTGASKSYISATLTAALITVVLVGFFESKQHGPPLLATQQPPTSSDAVNNKRVFHHISGEVPITALKVPKQAVIEEIEESSSSQPPTMPMEALLSKPPQLRHTSTPQPSTLATNLAPSSVPPPQKQRSVVLTSSSGTAPIYSVTTLSPPPPSRRRWNNSLITFGEYLRQRNANTNGSNIIIDAAVAAGNEAWHKMLVARNRFKLNPDEYRRQQQPSQNDYTFLVEGPCPSPPQAPSTPPKTNHHQSSRNGHFPSTNIDVVVTWVNGSDPIHQFKKITDKLLLRSSSSNTTNPSRSVMVTFVCECLRLEEATANLRSNPKVSSYSPLPGAFIGGIGPSVKRISGIDTDKQTCRSMMTQATLGNLLHIAPELRVAFPGLKPEYLRQGPKNNNQQQSAVSGRDRDSGELRILLRSMDVNMAWHTGDTSIVAPGQVPSWVDRKAAFLSTSPRVEGRSTPSTTKGGLRFIHQDALITGKTVESKPTSSSSSSSKVYSTLPEKVAAKSLPTFNTNVLEYFLYKINNRGNHWNNTNTGVDDAFIHMNDDYMILSPTTLSTFFTDNGGAKLYFEGGVIGNTTKSVWGDVEARQEKQLLLNNASRKCIEQQQGGVATSGEQQQRSIVAIHHHQSNNNNSGGGVDHTLMRKSWITAVEFTNHIIQDVLYQHEHNNGVISSSARGSGEEEIRGKGNHGEVSRNHFLKHAPFVSSRRLYDTLLRHCPSISTQIIRTFPLHKHRNAFSVIAPQLHHSMMPYLNDLEDICSTTNVELGSKKEKKKECVVDCSGTDNDSGGELGTVAPFRKPQVKKNNKELDTPQQHPLPLPLKQIGADSSAVLLVFTESIAGNDAKIFAALNRTSPSLASTPSRCANINQQQQILPTFLTINDGLGDGGDSGEVEELQEQVRYYQEALFPDPSPYENQQQHKATEGAASRSSVVVSDEAYCRFMCRVPWYATIPNFWVNKKEWSDDGGGGTFIPAPTSPICPLLRSITSQWRQNNHCGCNKPNISFHVDSNDVVVELMKRGDDDDKQDEGALTEQEQPFWFVGCSALELEGIPVTMRGAGRGGGKDNNNNDRTTTFHMDLDDGVISLREEHMGRIGSVSINLLLLSIPSSRGGKVMAKEFLVVGEVFHIGSFGRIATATTKPDNNNDHHDDDDVAVMLLPGVTHMIHQDTAVDLYRSFPVPYTTGIDRGV